MVNNSWERLDIRIDICHVMISPEVPPELLQHLAEVLRAEHLAADQEEDAHRREAGGSVG